SPPAASGGVAGAAPGAACRGARSSPTASGDGHDVPPLRVGRKAELVSAAPATADLMARAAAGLADDLLASILLMARCPVVFAPAMHTEMWEHPATRANVRTLRERGCLVLDPASGRLTPPDPRPRRLPQPPDPSP